MLYIEKKSKSCYFMFNVVGGFIVSSCIRRCEFPVSFYFEAQLVLSRIRSRMLMKAQVWSVGFNCSLL
jgi:hypothetical protein